MTLGIIEILLVIVVFLVLGPRRIANLFRSLGRGAQDFMESLGRDKKDKKDKELPENRDKSEE